RGELRLRRRLAARRPTLALLAVVRVVEARSLEVDRHRVEDALDGGVAGAAARDGVLAHSLHHLEGVPLLAAVLVDRHGTLSIGVLAAAPARFPAAFRA